MNSQVYEISNVEEGRIIIQYPYLLSILACTQMKSDQVDSLKCHNVQNVDNFTLLLLLLFIE